MVSTIYQRASVQNLLRLYSFQDEVFLEEGKAFDNQVVLLAMSRSWKNQ